MNMMVGYDPDTETESRLSRYRYLLDIQYPFHFRDYPSYLLPPFFLHSNPHFIYFSTVSTPPTTDFWTSQ